MAEYETIICTIENAVATITLDRPDRLNAATPQMFGELRAALDTLKVDGARALVLTGAGRGFCAGADLAGRTLDGGSPGSASRESLMTTFNPTLLALHELDLPIVAAVNGAAAGVGCSLALAADIVLAGESAYFLQAFVNIGLVPDGGATWLLPRAIGTPRAMEAMLLGERIPAARAEAIGLVARCVADRALMDDAQALAKRLATGPTRAMALIRKTVRAGLDGTLAEAMHREAQAQKQAGDTQDFQEGVAAFLEKREATFSGE